MDKIEKRLVKLHNKAINRLARAKPGSREADRAYRYAEQCWAYLKAHRESLKRG